MSRLIIDQKSVHSTSVVETGIDKLIISFFNAYLFKKLPPKTIGYQNYKNFDISSFFYVA